MSKVLIILDDPPSGTERSFNGLRLAKALSGKDARVTVFPMADAVACAKAGQTVPQGSYNLKLMVKRRLRAAALSCSAAPVWMHAESVTPS